MVQHDFYEESHHRTVIKQVSSLKEVLYIGQSSGNSVECL